jgi:hypothetical protein
VSGAVPGGVDIQCFAGRASGDQSRIGIASADAFAFSLVL